MNKKGKYILLYFLVWAIGWSGYAQSDTVVICNPGDSVQLSAPKGDYLYRWSPVEGLNNPFSRTPVARPLKSTVYTVEIIPLPEGENIIENPGFEAGNSGFSSDYRFVETINIQGVYGINESAARLNRIYFSDCPDQTTGTGLMMVIDGSPVPNQKVWCQRISVEPGTFYAFAAWLTSVNPFNPAELQFSINGSPIGAIFRATDMVCEWRQFYAIWESGGATAAEICIVNRNTNPNGNDFALDDLFFTALGSPTYQSTRVIVEALEAARFRRVYLPTVFSPNKDGVNDEFGPLCGKGVTQLRSFQVFNRWGTLVFERTHCPPNAADCYWDGTMQGNPLDPGTYVYLAAIEYADGKVKIKKGTVELVR